LCHGHAEAERHKQAHKVLHKAPFACRHMLKPCGVDVSSPRLERSSDCAILHTYTQWTPRAKAHQLRFFVTRWCSNRKRQ